MTPPPPPFPHASSSPTAVLAGSSSGVLGGNMGGPASGSGGPLTGVLIVALSYDYCKFPLQRPPLSHASVLMVCCGCSSLHRVG